MADGMLSLSWNNHSSTFSHTLATLRAKERYTDVTIACCGKFYPVHKLVLSTCSEYFETMFEQTPCKHPVIVLRDIQCDELEALLNYMYAGVVSVAQSDLARLIKVAELLQIKGLAVPDEPPKSNKSFSHSDKTNSHPRTRQYNSLSSEKSSPHTRSRHSHSSSDDRLSPNAKRRRLDNNSSELMEAPSLSNSPGVPNVSSPQKDSERHANRSGTWSDHQEGSTEGHREEEGEYQSNSQDPLMSPEEVNVDESLVKEEVVEDAGDQNDLSESGVDYDEYAGESTGGADGQDNMGLLLPKYDDTPSNQQSASHSAVDQHAALPDAVIEALAGPSGMQGWPGGGELTRRLGENFGEMNQDLSPGNLGQAGSQAHQVVSVEA